MNTRVRPPESRSGPFPFLAALACLALGVLAGGCVGPLPEESDDSVVDDRAKQLIVEDASVLITSGTTTLRHIRASHAVFHEDSRYLEASSLTLTLNIPDRSISVTAHASRGEVFLAAGKGRDSGKGNQIATLKAGMDAAKGMAARQGLLPADPLEPVGFQEMKRLAYLPREQRSFGDVVLFGPVTGETSDGGSFRAQTVFWSETMKRLMVPEPFRQKVYAPNGGAGEISAAAFEVDSTLRHWVYYADTAPGEILWDATAAGIPNPNPPPPDAAREGDTQRSPAP
jgi:hypothetical protein